MKRHFLCFKTAINTGLIHSRIDVLGVRDIGGHLSGDVETISIEVKRNSEPFATASGQALGYKIYTNRVYLADIRDGSFTNEEIRIASHLGIGLIQIKKGKCIEILSSPFYVPMISHKLALLEKLALVKCQICDSFFATGTNMMRDVPWNNLTKSSIDEAVAKGKGFVFWIHEIYSRKSKVGLTHINPHYMKERRYICPECVQNFFEDIAERDKWIEKIRS